MICARVSFVIGIPPPGVSAGHYAVNAGASDDEGGVRRPWPAGYWLEMAIGSIAPSAMAAAKTANQSLTGPALVL